MVEQALRRREGILQEKERQRLLEQERLEQAEALENKGREVKALNRLFQAELSGMSSPEKSGTVEFETLDTDRPRTNGNDKTG